MDLRKIGVFLIFIGILITIAFLDNEKIFVPALTITVLGFFVTVVGYVSEIRKRKIINDKLDEDVGTILQPLITKYSNLNKQYRSEFEGEEYVQKRLQLNRDLEKEIAEKLPYLESREIKKIVLEFSKEQDKIN
ncbi:MULTISPECIES: hypothetical protein [unclassified Methanobrevibacter]|uniref:hypothetical protein n=1 Tax=unclassified Methanobrevibacter TaxID=2638681 RepID=UPI001DB4923D|nr:MULTISPECIES: hypothetical protein [unclassified Methanobrevibacter]MBE6492661.1 hypothetical protein [Methanobrevibacter sp.]MEE0943786.1 hypothetical protein [Methanobrevibacter sp.]